MGVTVPLGNLELAYTSGTLGTGSSGGPASTKKLGQMKTRAFCITTFHSLLSLPTLGSVFSYERHFSGTLFMTPVRVNAVDIVLVTRDTDIYAEEEHQYKERAVLWGRVALSHSHQTFH